jgi:hypothetical protein
MKSFLKKYFLLVANHPFKAAAAVGFICTFPVIIVAFIIVLDIERLDAIKKSMVLVFIAIFLLVSFVNVIVPLMFMTHFFKNGRKIVVIRSENDIAKSTIYQRSIWGKVPHIKIYFPEDWDLNDDSAERNLKLEVIVPVVDRSFAYFTFNVGLIFNGNFCARDLENMISQQQFDRQDADSFNFQYCLQRIIAHRLIIHRALLKDYLLQWEQKIITTKDLEIKLVGMELIPNSLFSNIDKISMQLLNPSVTNKQFIDEN